MKEPILLQRLMRGSRPSDRPIMLNICRGRKKTAALQKPLEPSVQRMKR
jgi:hypothetical protein